MKKTGIKKYYNKQYKNFKVNWDRIRSIYTATRSWRSYNSVQVFEMSHNLILDAIKPKLSKYSDSRNCLNPSEYLRLYMMVIPKASHHEILLCSNYVVLCYGISFYKINIKCIEFIFSLMDFIYSMIYNTQSNCAYET